MDRTDVTTDRIKASEARQLFGKLLNKVFGGEKRIIIEKSGIPVAALVSVDDLRRLERYDQLERERFKVLEEMRSAFSDVSTEEIEREVSKAIEEVRREKRQKSRRSA